MLTFDSSNNQTAKTMHMHREVYLIIKDDAATVGYLEVSELKNGIDVEVIAQVFSDGRIESERAWVTRPKKGEPLDKNSFINGVGDNTAFDEDRNVVPDRFNLLTWIVDTCGVGEYKVNQQYYTKGEIKFQ